MAIRKPSLRPVLAALVLAGAALVPACGADDSGDDSGAGGSGPAGAPPSGGAPASTGGTSAGTGGTPAAGGAATGGEPGVGGGDNGGAASGGVAATGGAVAVGGSRAGSGGANPSETGGSATGGIGSTGGGATGGVTTGGTVAGGGAAIGGDAPLGGAGAAGAAAGLGGGAGADAGAGGAGVGGGGAGGAAPRLGLGWPIDCVLGVDCQVAYPDTDGDGVAFDCGAPGYAGHQGTDISIDWAAMDAGTDVLAADDGEVLWVFDGHYDRCPDAAEPDCAEPALDMAPGVQSGYLVCTDARDEYCVGTEYTTDCFFCFAGANVVVIRHPEGSVAFATRYDHLRNGSIVVEPGQTVRRGDKIAEVGSAGNSTGPHLHFEVWVGGYYVLADPWAGPCGPNRGPSLWDPSLGL